MVLGNGRMGEVIERIRSVAFFFGVSAQKATSDRCAIDISIPRMEFGLSALPIVTLLFLDLMIEVDCIRSNGWKSNFSSLHHSGRFSRSLEYIPFMFADDELK